MNNMKMAKLNDPLTRYFRSRTLQNKALLKGESPLPTLLLKGLGIRGSIDNYADHRKFWLLKGVLVALISFLAFIDLYTQVTTEQSIFTSEKCWLGGQEVECDGNIQFSAPPKNVYSLKDYEDALVESGGTCSFPKPLAIQFKFESLGTTKAWTSNPVLIVTIIQVLILICFGASVIYILFVTAKHNPLVVYLLKTERILHTRYGLVRKNLLWVLIGVLLLTYLILLIPVRETLTLEGCSQKVEYEHKRAITFAAVKGTLLTLVLVALKVQGMDQKHYGWFNIHKYYYDEKCSYTPMPLYTLINQQPAMDSFGEYLNNIESGQAPSVLLSQAQSNARGGEGSEGEGRRDLHSVAIGGREEKDREERISSATSTGALLTPQGKRQQPLQKQIDSAFSEEKKDGQGSQQ